MENEQTGNPIIIKTFGTFSLMYNGRSLAGQKAMESQFAYLMQMVLHYRRDGISREAVEEVLFGTGMWTTRAMPSAPFYTTRGRSWRRRLESCRTAATISSRRDGMLYWTDDVPVEEDAALFENLWQQAKRRGTGMKGSGSFWKRSIHTQASSWALTWGSSGWQRRNGATGSCSAAAWRRS